MLLCVSALLALLCATSCRRDAAPGPSVPFAQTPNALASATPVPPTPAQSATVPRSSPPTATQTPRPTRTPRPTTTATPTPTASATASSLLVYPAIAFVSDAMGSDDVYLLRPDTGRVLRITTGPGEDRDPALSADGRALLYRSNADGIWALYQVDLVTAQTRRLEIGTGGAFIGHPSWRPGDLDQVAYESYQDGNLNVYVRDGATNTRKLTEHPAGDYDPAWAPDGARIAFTSWREGQKDLYLADVDGQRMVRLTMGRDDEEEPTWHPDGDRLTYVCWKAYDADLCELDLDTGHTAVLVESPYPDRSPTYAADGTLYWVRYEPGEPFEVHDPRAPGVWRLWIRDPSKSEHPVVLSVGRWDIHTPAAGLAYWPEHVFPVVAEAASPMATPTNGLVKPVALDVVSAGERARIHPDLVDAYAGWRRAVREQTGYDFLGTISDAFRPLGYSHREYGHLSWHRAGRAVDTLFEWHDPPDAPNALVVTREDLGPHTYWRMYLRCQKQDGTMGEPLTVPLWVFWFDLDRSQEAEAAAAGGRPGDVPRGYYVDITQIAARYGWHRIASYQEPDFDWRTDSVGREFWHYQRTDGLTWWEAMRQLYPLETLNQFYGWDVCTKELGLDPAWLRAKGIPTPTPAAEASKPQ